MTPSREARIAAGYSLEEIARRCRITVAYLQRCEGSQQFSFVLAFRLSNIYKCGLDVFLGRGRRSAARTGDGSGSPTRPKRRLLSSGKRKHR